MRVKLESSNGVYVGDPCYTQDTCERWVKWGAACTEKSRYAMQVEGQVAAVPAKYGNGLCAGTDGYWYRVVGGLIGVVDKSCVDNEKAYQHGTRINEVGTYWVERNNGGWITITTPSGRQTKIYAGCNWDK